MTARTNKELKTFQMDAILNVFIHSHQDTVVALDALSKHGAVTFSRRQKTTLVTIQSTGSFSQKFQVENSNRLLLQQVPLPDIPGDYTMSVSGEGCVYAQVRCWVCSCGPPSSKWKVWLSISLLLVKQTLVAHQHAWRTQPMHSQDDIVIQSIYINSKSLV